MKHIKKTGVLLLIFLFTFGCKTEDKPQLVKSNGNLTEIELPYSMIKKAGFKFEKAQVLNSENVLNCKGFIVNDEKNFRNITSTFSGKIVSVRISGDQFVKAGEIVAFIEDSEMITLQQNFLEAKNQYEFYKEEYSRQGDLTVENATSLKKMQIARRDFHSAELKYRAYERALINAGFQPDSITIDNIISRFAIRSPWTGDVRQVTIYPGNYVNKGTVVANIEKTGRKFIQAEVPERAFLEVKVGDTVKCWLSYDSLKIFKSVVTGKSSELDPRKQSGILYAVVPENLELITGMSVVIEVLQPGYNPIVVSTYAIFNADSISYLFVKKQGRFLKIRVTTEPYNHSIKVIDLPVIYTDSIVTAGVKRLNHIFREL